MKSGNVSALVGAMLAIGGGLGPEHHSRTLDFEKLVYFSQTEEEIKIAKENAQAKRARKNETRLRNHCRAHHQD